MKRGIGSVTLPGFGTFDGGQILAGDSLQQYVPTFLEVYTGEVESSPVKLDSASAPVQEVAPVLTEVVPASEAPPIQEQRSNKKGR